VGAYLRNAGIDAVVWGKLDETAHQPNEYCVVENLVGDACVFASFILASGERGSAQ
jgi:succinyl-diaminopimelate desuccinylase